MRLIHENGEQMGEGTGHCSPRHSVPHASSRADTRKATNNDIIERHS